MADIYFSTVKEQIRVVKKDQPVYLSENLKAAILEDPNVPAVVEEYLLEQPSPGILWLPYSSC